MAEQPEPGRTAYEARFAGFPLGPRGISPHWADLGPEARAIWAGVEAAVIRADREPQPGWREKGEADPHGNRYDCPREKIAGGHLTDDQVAYQTAMLMRNDLNFEGILSVAKDRIRWLSRQKSAAEAALKAAEGERDELRESNRRILAKGGAQLVAAEAEASRLRDELARVNNEFGSQTADWPEAWKRVADLKQNARDRWQENARLREEKACLQEARDECAREVSRLRDERDEAVRTTCRRASVLQILGHHPEMTVEEAYAARDEVERLRGALRPFADEAAAWDASKFYRKGLDTDDVGVALGHLRAARTALSLNPEKTDAAR